MPRVIALLIVLQLTSAYAKTVDLGAFNERQICKAAISIVMGRSPSIMSIDRIEGGVVYLSYVRSNDRSRWHYRCKIQGSKIVWASETGRWRTDREDSVITFTISGNTLRVVDRFSDGSASSQSFELKELGDRNASSIDWA